MKATTIALSISIGIAVVIATFIYQGLKLYNVITDNFSMVWYGVQVTLVMIPVLLIMGYVFVWLREVFIKKFNEKEKDMSWNYRVIKHDEKETVYYNIHEVYYDKKGKVDGISLENIAPMGETKEEVIEDLKIMLNDANKHPVLSMTELEKRWKKNDKKVKK
jgi:hypothetical protein